MKRNRVLLIVGLSVACGWLSPSKTAQVPAEELNKSEGTESADKGAGEAPEIGMPSVSDMPASNSAPSEVPPSSDTASAAPVPQGSPPPSPAASSDASLPASTPSDSSSSTSSSVPTSTPPETPAPTSSPASIISSGVGFEDAQKEAPADADVIDTVDAKSSSGNWVFKNYWWRKIEELYSDIKEAFNRVMTSRMTFFSSRSEVDTELDRFYQQTGLEQGPLEDIIHLALEIMDKEKKDQGFLNKKERAFLEKVKDRQRQLEQLKLDVKAIEELDKKIDDALDVVVQQVDVCSKYEQTAWATVKDVARELSDKEARKQYYQTKGLLEDVNKVHSYLTGEFNTYFQQMVQSVQEHTQGIVAQLSALEKDGINFKKEADVFEEEDEELEKAANDKKRKEEEKEAAKKAKEKGFIARTVRTVKGWFAAIGNFFISIGKRITGLFGTKSKTIKVKPSKAEIEKTAQSDTSSKDTSSPKDETGDTSGKKKGDASNIVPSEPSVPVQDTTPETDVAV